MYWSLISSLHQHYPSSKANSPPKHFSTITENEIQVSITNRIPINTKKNTTWRLETQCIERMVSGKEIDEELLTIAINILMSRFIQEVKRKHGNPYLRSSLVSLVSGIQRYLRENGRAAVSFFNEKDSTYD